MPTRSRYISNFIISGNDIANGAITFSDLGVIYTSNITEGTNLYFSNARARAALSVSGAGSYDNSTGIVTITGGVTSVNGANGAVVLSTVNIAESGNLYFTNARARAALSVTGAATYDNSTGIINVTGGISSVDPYTGNIKATGSITADVPFFLGNTMITANFTVPTGFNAMTPGPVTVANTVVITVPDGSTWTVV